MKREDAMQGYWSVAVDEKRPSLAVDDAVLVGAPAWWRTVAMDVVEDGGDGWGGRRRLVWGWGVLARTVYEWENGGRGTGNHVFGTRLSEIWESYELSPRLKFGRLVGWGYEVITHLANICPERFRARRGWLAPMVYERG